MRSTFLLSSLLLFSAGCDIGRPVQEHEQLPTPDQTTFVSAGPEGLQQTVELSLPSTVPDEAKILGIRTSVVNNGIHPMTVITRACGIRSEDITRGETLVLTPVTPPECDRLLDTLELQPGQGTSTLETSFKVDASPSTQTVRVQQIYSPGFATEVKFVIR
jgi:hypothetical protein